MLYVIIGEWYEDDEGIRECYGYEDSDCADQWYILSTEDHMRYLHVYLTCPP